jgi:hypothetical protein
MDSDLCLPITRSGMGYLAICLNGKSRYICVCHMD